MSSLQSIMNLDEDQQEASSPMEKNDKDRATPASGFRRQDPSTSTSSSQPTRTDQQYSSTSSAPTTTTPATEDRKLHYPPQQPIAADPGSSSSGKRPAEFSSAIPTLSAASSGPGDLRRQSITSVDSMDQYGYASSSSMGGGSGGGFPPNHPRRPMGASPSPDVPVRYTPITGRVSRAKKGVPVHICESCNPPKTFTRAEHLRRHQLSHQNPRFPCDQCEKAFHRQDLLTRHQQRHNQEGGDPSFQEGNDQRRASDDSGTSGPSLYQPPYPSVSRGVGGASTPSSLPDPPPGTPAAGSRSGSIGRGGADPYGPSPDQNSNYRIMPAPTQPGSSMQPSPGSLHCGMIPRTMPPFVSTDLPMTAALQKSLDHPPDLVPSKGYLSWTSGSDTPPYSTPGDQSSGGSRHAQNVLGWQAGHDLLSAFPNHARRAIHTAGDLGTMATASYYDPNSFPTSPLMTPVSHHTFGALLGDDIMTEFQNPSLMGSAIAGSHAMGHQRSSSVRCHTSEISIATSGQMADTLVTPAPLPRLLNPMAEAQQKMLLVDDGTQDEQMGILSGVFNWNGDSPGDSGVPTGAGLITGCGSSGPTVSTPLPRSVWNAIPAYINAYWERFHILYPLVHRSVFEEHGEDVLRYAMAAIATQYMSSREDRIRGNLLHELAWQEAKRYAGWNLQVMQAILLCELFARFRGRKAVVRPSKLFEKLYSRVLDQSPDLCDPALPFNAASFEEKFPMEGLDMVKEERWRSWIQTEGQRRLLAGCFIVDNHAAMMHQQPAAKDSIDCSTIPLTGPSNDLWSASSADEWSDLLRRKHPARHAQFLPPLDSLGPEELARYTEFDRAAILHAATLGLQRRNSRRVSADKGDEQEIASGDDLRTPTSASYAARIINGSTPEDTLLRLFSLCYTLTPHIYVALHHTPLHDLLAVSGESWVLSQKVLGAPTFHEHQKRLRAWVDGRSATSPTSPMSPSTAGLEGMSATKATLHAACALVGYFDRGLEAACVSDYWALYVCTLIIWAFSQKAGKPASSASSGSPTTGTQPMREDEAITWLRGIADSSEPQHVSRAKGRREASFAIVSMVKRRLEADCVGGRSRLYVDAVGVLTKLEEGVNQRWF